MTVALALAPLSLHRPPSPVLVRAAAAAGYQAVGLRLALPDGGLAPECTDGKARAALASLIRDEGLGVLEISNVELVADFDLDASQRAIEAAVELEARYLQVVDWDPELARATDNLGRVAALTAQAGLGIALEFMPYSHARRLGDARALLATLHLGQGEIVFDVLHFVRSGGLIDELRAGPNTDVAFVQLCDAHAEAPPPDRLRHEALTDRLPPGEGALPVTEILNAIGNLPAVSVEAPCRDLADSPPEEQARILRAASTKLLDLLDA
jgi:sugar phosphate isomerase/epimerase